VSVLSRRHQTAGTRRNNEGALTRATLELLDEGLPFAGIGIEQIVSRAGLSRPTFYSYFDDKRALVLRLGEQVEVQLAEVADPWLEGHGVSLRETLQAVLDVLLRNSAALRALIEAATYDEDVAAFWRRFHESFIPRAEKRIKASNPKLARKQVAARAFALVWMTERALVEHVTRPTVDEQALLDQVSWFWSVATAPGR
jgi:AcrR family transcriptional regulator